MPYIDTEPTVGTVRPRYAVFKDTEPTVCTVRPRNAVY